MTVKLETDKELTALMNRACWLALNKQEFVDLVAKHDSILEVVPGGNESYEMGWTSAFLKFGGNVKVYRVGSSRISVNPNVLMVLDRETFTNFLNSEIEKVQSKHKSQEDLLNSLVDKIGKTTADERGVHERFQKQIEDAKEAIEHMFKHGSTDHEFLVETTREKVKFLEGLLSSYKSTSPDFKNVKKAELLAWVQDRNKKTSYDNWYFVELESLLLRGDVSEKLVETAISTVILKEVMET